MNIPWNELNMQNNNWNTNCVFSIAKDPNTHVPQRRVRHINAFINEKIPVTLFALLRLTITCMILPSTMKLPARIMEIGKASRK